jgi:hypothetical protein
MPVAVKKAAPPATKAQEPSIVASNPAAKALAEAVAKDEAVRAAEKHKASEVHISPEVPAASIEQAEPIKTEIQVERPKPKKR